MPTESETSKKQYAKTLFSDNIRTDVNGNNLEVHFGEPFSYLQALTTNSLMNNTGRGPKFYCYQCDYFLHTQLSMITHMKMHRKPFCPICFEVFEDDEGLIAAEYPPVHVLIRVEINRKTC
uniref:C2H2-type domain-containing protein n=1 Tax=Anopheles farauti TaxID=69004 RepID=A0A182R0Z2_9DIPT